MQRKDLLPEGVTFNGNYEPITQDGIFQPALVIMSNLDIQERDLMKQPSENRRDFILEPHVDIQFDQYKKQFKVNGDSLNRVNNIYRDNERRFALQLDSLTTTIQKQYPDAVIPEQEYKKMRRNLFIQEKKSTLQLIRKNARSQPSLQNFVIYAMVPIIPVAEVRSVFNQFPLAIRTGKKGLYVDSLIAAQENMMKGGLKVGAQMPVFSLQNAKGEMVTSSSVMGKYTLIDFWASWCAPCRAETPNLIKAYNDFHSKGFNIMAISIDQVKDRAKWLEAIDKDHSAIWINLFNPGATDNVAKELGVNAIPDNYLVDDKGIIIARNLRGGNLQEMLKKILK